jgi:hypothetical protein
VAVKEFKFMIYVEYITTRRISTKPSPKLMCLPVVSVRTGPAFTKPYSPYSQVPGQLSDGQFPSSLPTKRKDPEGPSLVPSILRQYGPPAATLRTHPFWQGQLGLGLMTMIMA